VPGGPLNLKSTNLPRPWSPRESSPSGKIPTVEPGIEPGTSWLVGRDSDHYTTRLVSFCNVNIVDFSSGRTWFETQQELLVSLWGSVPQFLCQYGPQVDGHHSNPYASIIISRPVTLNELTCYSTKFHCTTISLISSTISRVSSRFGFCPEYCWRKVSPFWPDADLFHRQQGPLLALYGIVNSSLSVYS